MCTPQMTDCAFLKLCSNMAWAFLKLFVHFQKCSIFNSHGSMSISRNVQFLKMVFKNRGAFLEICTRVHIFENKSCFQYWQPFLKLCVHFQKCTVSNNGRNIYLGPPRAAHTVLDAPFFFNKKDIVSANYIAAGLNATTNKQTKSTSKFLVLLE